MTNFQTGKIRISSLYEGGQRKKGCSYQQVHVKQEKKITISNLCKRREWVKIRLVILVNKNQICKKETGESRSKSDCSYNIKFQIRKQVKLESPLSVKGENKIEGVIIRLFISVHKYKTGKNLRFPSL